MARATTSGHPPVRTDVLPGRLSSDEVDEPVADVVQLAQKSPENAPESSANQRENGPEVAQKVTAKSAETAPEPVQKTGRW